MIKERHFLLLFLWAVCCTGCTISETVEVQIRPMPTLRLAYAAPSASKRVVADARSYAFLSDGVFQNSVLSPMGGVVDLLKGVAQVDYTVVSFATNGPGCSFSVLDKGVSRLDGLQCLIDPLLSSAPELWIARASYAVRRTDTIETRVVEFGRLYYDVELRIDGPQWLTVPLDAYRVSLTQLPSGYDYTGAALPPEVAPYTRCDPFVQQAEVNGPLRAWFRIGRFDSKRGFVFTLWQSDRLVLSALVAEGVQGMQIEGDVLQISVVMGLTDPTLVVNDWELVGTHSPGIGG